MTASRAHTRPHEASLSDTPRGRVAKLFISTPSPCSRVNTPGVNDPRIVNTGGSQ